MSVVGYTDQALRYFIRPEAGQPTEAIAHPAAWLGSDLAADPDRWLVQLTPTAVAELSEAADRLLAAGVALSDVTRDRFVLPTLAEQIADWRETLRAGSGVVCLRGLPVRAWGDEKSALVYWGLGHHLGAPGAQNPDGELLGHVKDYGEQSDSPLVRLYRTTDEIAFHCDGADAVGLLCLRTAAEGGQSRIASSVAVFNEVLRRRPDLAPELFQPFEIDRRDEEGPGEAPTLQIAPCAFDGTLLRTFWHSDYMRSAERHDGVAFSAARQELVELYDEIAASEAFRFDMWLEEGDVQLISNHTVIHARTGYVDHADVDERRHLLRLWLSLG